MKFFRLIFTLETSSPASPSSSEFHLARETSELFWKVTKLVDTYNCFTALIHHPAKREGKLFQQTQKIILDPNWLTDSQEEVIVNNLTTACARSPEPTV